MKEIVNTGGEKSFVHTNKTEYDPDHPAVKGVQKYYKEEYFRKKKRKELNRKIMIFLFIISVIGLIIYSFIKF